MVVMQCLEMRTPAGVAVQPGIIKTVETAHQRCGLGVVARETLVTVEPAVAATRMVTAAVALAWTGETCSRAIMLQIFRQLSSVRVVAADTVVEAVAVRARPQRLMMAAEAAEALSASSGGRAARSRITPNDRVRRKLRYAQRPGRGPR